MYQSEDYLSMKHTKTCPHCCEIVLPTDNFAVVNDGQEVFHFECFMRTMVGSVSHQLKKCSCYGGDQEDPPEWTARQAAKAASDLYHKGCYENPPHKSTALPFRIPDPSLN